MLAKNQFEEVQTETGKYEGARQPDTVIRLDKARSGLAYFSRMLGAVSDTAAAAKELLHLEELLVTQSFTEEFQRRFRRPDIRKFEPPVPLVVDELREIEQSRMSLLEMALELTETDFVP